jgi:hypothetical protein
MTGLDSYDRTGFIWQDWIHMTEPVFHVISRGRQAGEIFSAIKLIF